MHVAKLYSWTELWKGRDLPPSASGVYAWFFKNPPSSVPIDRCIHREGRALLYVGISPESKNSGQNLRQRIRYHFSGNAEGSTLRRTLGCLLEEELGTILRRVGSGKRMTFGPNESKLAKWMTVNAAVSWIEAECPWEIEDYLLTKLTLPLNIEANSHGTFYEALRTIRKQCCERARLLPVLESS
ncbi:GIY-YIG nuclease family protein [Nitrospira sp. Nam80]